MGNLRCEIGWRLRDIFDGSDRGRAIITIHCCYATVYEQFLIHSY
jgi:hypothetical protein